MSEALPSGAAAAARPRRRVRRDLVRPALIALASVGCGAVLALLAAIVWLSFASGTPGDPALVYGLRNYLTMFGDPFTYRVLWNTAQFVAITLAVAFAIALPIAWLMERSDFPGKPI